MRSATFVLTPEYLQLPVLNDLKEHPLISHRRLAAAAVAFAAVLVLAGCAPSTVGLPGSHPTVTVRHTATPTAKPKPRLLVWSGDCTVFFTDAQSQAVTAHPTTLQPPSPYLYGYDQVTALAGGHDCNYADADSDSENIAISIFPASLPGAVTTAPHCQNANSGQVHFQDLCTASVVTHGFWMNVDFTPGDSLTYAQAFAGVTAITSGFVTKTALYAAPKALATPAGTWTKSETCDTLAAHSNAAAAIGYPSFSHSDDPMYDGNGDAFSAAEKSVGALGCNWGVKTGLAPNGKVTGFEVYLVPGGGMLNPAAAAPVNATAVSIPGASAAWDIEYNGNNVDFIYVVAGANYFEFTPDGNQTLSLGAVAPAISKIISTMNAGG